MIDKTVEVRLIRRAKSGDGDAIAQLIRSHQDALYAFILRMSGRPDVAEDVVQEAFVRVIRNLDRFDTRYRFSTWLFTIAKRLYVNAVQKHRPAYDTDMVEIRRGSDPTPGSISSRMESLQNVRRLLDTVLLRLNEQQREVVLLFHQQDWSINEIAEHLGMPEGTVKSHLHRARKRMRKAIGASETLQRHAEEVFS